MRLSTGYRAVPGAADSLKAIEPEFNAAYPDISIDWTEYPPADTYRNALLAISAGSGAPDVLLLASELRIFMTIVLPTSLPGLATLGSFSS